MGAHIDWFNSEFHPTVINYFNSNNPDSSNVKVFIIIISIFQLEVED